MKTVLITGANTGIGLAATSRFLAGGYQVCAHYHTGNSNLEKLDRPCLHMFCADLGNLEDIDRMFSLCMDATKGKGPDILVNNAAIYQQEESIDILDSDKMDQSLRVNLKAPFILTQKAMQGMKKRRWGRIINISSIGIKFGGATTAGFYTISKAALEAMTLTFSKVGAPHNVLVNALRVGTTNTELHRRNPGKNLDEIIKRIPLGRMAEPKEVADSIYFLASEESSYITGSIITIAGGA